MPDTTLEKAHRAAEAFARALVPNDLAALAGCLAADCAGDFGSLTVRGRDAIVATYAAATVEVERSFDEVRREAAIESVAGGVAHVVLTEYRLEVPGHWRRHRRVLELAVSEDGAIVRIVERPATPRAG